MLDHVLLIASSVGQAHDGFQAQIPPVGQIEEVPHLIEERPLLRDLVKEEGLLSLDPDSGDLDPSAIDLRLQGGMAWRMNNGGVKPFEGKYEDFLRTGGYAQEIPFAGPTRTTYVFKVKLEFSPKFLEVRIRENARNPISPAVSSGFPHMFSVDRDPVPGLAPEVGQYCGRRCPAGASVLRRRAARRTKARRRDDLAVRWLDWARE